MKQILFILIAGLLWSAPLSAQQSDTLKNTQTEDPGTESTENAPENASLESLWDEANTAYLRSDFRTAIRTYQEILDRGMVSAKLYYNLGNACFKDNRTGEAILYYHRALLLKPGDEDIRYNLSVAEGRTIDRIEPIPEFFLKEWLHTLRTQLGGTTWTILSLLLLALTLTSGLLFLLAQRLSLRKGGFFAGLGFGVLFLITTLFASSARREVLDHDRAVVLSSAVSVKSSPDKSATDLFVLHEGTCLTLGEALGDWQEITIADGKKGWLEKRHIEAI